MRPLIKNRNLGLIGAIGIASVGLLGCSHMSQMKSDMTHMMPSSKQSSSSKTNPVANLGKPVKQREGKLLKVSKIKLNGKSGQLTSKVGNDVKYHSQGATDRAVRSSMGSGLAGSVASTVANQAIKQGVKHVKNKADTKTGVRLVVRMKKSQKIITLKQPGTPKTFSSGQKVLVDWFSSGATRVETLKS